jgi:signal transduction histidine kinase
MKILRVSFSLFFILNGLVFLEAECNDTASKDLHLQSNDELAHATVLQSSGYYELIELNSDSLLNLISEYKTRLILGNETDSIFYAKLVTRINELRELIKKENILKTSMISEREHQVELISHERYILTRNLLFIVSLLAIILLILSYSRYRIIKNSKEKLEAKQVEISDANMKLVSINKELTEHEKKLEILNQELNEANQKLIKSEKKLLSINASKDKFFSIISHDLRNPFASIAGFSRIIKRDINDLSENELLELVSEMDKSVLKINSLLDNLLMWSRSQAGKDIFFPQYLNLSEIVNDNIEVFSGNAKEKKINVKADLSKDLVVYGDKNMIETVVRNLLTNAIKYSRIGGEVTVSAKLDTNKAIVSFYDNGVGIPNEDKDKIFNPVLFHSTYGTNEEKGSGLGLMICKEFVEKLGGEISFTSQEGKGSVFTFSVPVDKS